MILFLCAFGFMLNYLLDLIFGKSNQSKQLRFKKRMRDGGFVYNGKGWVKK